MLKFLIIVCILTLIAIMLYAMPIRIKLKTLKKNEDDIVVIRVKTLYGIINLKFEIPFLDIVMVNNKPALKYKAEIESNKTSRLIKRISKIFSIDDFNNIKKYFHHDPIFLHWLKEYWFAKMTISDFTFILKYGLSDAALAAILYGTAWTILGLLLALGKSNLNLSIKEVAITPLFDREALSAEFACIIKFKFGDIINTGIMLLRRRTQRKNEHRDMKDTLNAI